MKRYGDDEVIGARNVLLWLEPGDVRYVPEDVDFLLEWLPDMREGAFPVEPVGDTGGTRSGIKTRAYYEAACQVAAELDTRLAQTGLDRELVEKSYSHEWSDDALASWYHMTQWDVRQKIDAAVSYIASGKCQRWIECQACSCFSSCRKKKKGERRSMTYEEWYSYRVKDGNRGRLYIRR